ncbi:GIY-YIG nuclease family protein [Marivirga arenosa]
MSTFFVYILFSSKINKFHIGYSQNPEKRLEFHNSTLNKIWSKKG